MIASYVRIQHKHLDEYLPEFQKRNYNKHKWDMEFGEKDRVWVRAYPLSKAEKFFTANLTPKWKGHSGWYGKWPVNNKVILEASGQDLKVVHISRLKPCYPNAQDLQDQERKRVLEILNEDSDEEDFLGFSYTACSAPSGGWVKGSSGRQEDYHHDSSSDSDIKSIYKSRTL